MLHSCTELVSLSYYVQSTIVLPGPIPSFSMLCSEKIGKIGEPGEQATYKIIIILSMNMAKQYDLI